ncbi:MAG: rod shape-determining protein RodA [Chloroflexi bacterium]|nr:MAG: rod shape-determining protein RodA [Chloroflexota bacterium]
MQRPSILIIGLLLASLAYSGCVQPAQGGSAAPQSAAQPAQVSSGPRVFFVEPASGAEVSSPVTVKFGAEGFTVEPAGEAVKPDHGHLHVMVDTDCIPAAQGIPNDETHLHYGKAQMEAEIELSPGEHTLCLQAADSNHVALAGEGMTHVITVKVR